MASTRSMSAVRLDEEMKSTYMGGSGHKVVQVILKIKEVFHDPGFGRHDDVLLAHGEGETVSLMQANTQVGLSAMTLSATAKPTSCPAASIPSPAGFRGLP